MNFGTFTDRLVERFALPLPGEEAHMRMTSLHRFRTLLKFIKTGTDKKSGVLIILYPDNQDIMTLFIQRPNYDGIHSGQISFPGGKMEENDRDLIETALRESYEEVGIGKEDVRIAGTLTELFIPPSNFTVLPVVGVLSHPPELHPDPVEVDQVITVSLRELLDPESFQMKHVSAGGWKGEVPCFYVKEKVIWGATSMILNEFLELVRPILSPQSASES